MFSASSFAYASDTQVEVDQLIQQFPVTKGLELLSVGDQIHACGPGAIPVLIQAMNSTDIPTLIGVQYALCKFGNASIQPLCDVLQGNSSDLAKRTALSALHLSANQTYYPTAAVPYILKVAESNNKSLRYEALYAFNPIKSHDGVVMPALLKGVGNFSDNFKYQMMAVSVVKKHVDRNESLIPFIGDRIMDSDKDTSVGAVVSLGFLSPRSVPVLLDHLESNSSTAVKRAIFSLAISGRKALAALPALNALSHHENKTIQKHAECGRLSLEADSGGYEKYVECVRGVVQ